MQEFAKLASCEKAPTCAGATEACFRVVFTETVVCDPRRRWMYCCIWKQKLGLVFDKDLGVYILPQCSCCGADLKKQMEAKL
jgi:hypothetical protein